MDAEKRRSVILLSGGLDSAANLAFCANFDEPVLALTIDYGQRAAVPEIKAAKAIAEYYGVPHRVLELKWLGELGGSSLTAAGEIPHLKANQLDDAATTKKSAAAVWVPNRNGLFVNVAGAIAESMKAPQIIVGFNKEEAATFPDNSSQFINVCNLSMRYSTATGVKLVCYTDMLDKTEIVRALGNLPKAFPMELVWSCYTAGPEKCGECESCQRFKRATGR